MRKTRSNEHYRLDAKGRTELNFTGKPITFSAGLDKINLRTPLTKDFTRVHHQIDGWLRTWWQNGHVRLRASAE